MTLRNVYKEFYEETIDCIFIFSICSPNLGVWNKLSTTISIEWIEVRYFTFERDWKH